MSVFVQALILIALAFICVGLVSINHNLCELGRIIEQNKWKGGEE
jgi:hypothetical protein